MDGLPIFEDLAVSVDGAVVTLTLDRPHARNALSTELMASLDAALSWVDHRADLRVVVIRGAGGHFCSGYDLVTRGAYRDQEQASARAIDPADRWSPLHTTWDAQRRNGEWWLKAFFNLRKPVIAQVEGCCLAGGLDLLGVCDLAVAGESASFGLPQARGVGVIHTMGLLPYLVGRRKSFEWCLTGDAFTAAEALDAGLVNQVVPDHAVGQEVAWLAERVSFMPKELLAAHKQAINRFYELMGVDTAVKSAGEYDAVAVQNPMLDEFRRVAAAEGIKAAFAWRDRPWREQPPPPWRAPSST